MIGYYVHHQGRGHCSRATAIAGRIDTDVVALTSASLSDPAFSEVITLDRDDADPEPREVDVHGLLHRLPWARRCRPRWSPRCTPRRRRGSSRL